MEGKKGQGKRLGGGRAKLFFSLQTLLIYQSLQPEGVFFFLVKTGFGRQTCRFCQPKGAFAGFLASPLSKFSFPQLSIKAVRLRKAFFHIVLKGF
jgi:hypothetical protein